MREGMGMGGRMGFAERPLISEMLFAREQLGLSPAQIEKLRGLRSGFEKEAIKKQAEIRVAEIDLSDLLAANPPDLGKIETQVMKIATLRGNLRFARIKTLDEGRAVLSSEQWQKFQNLASSPRGPHGMRWQQGQIPGPHGMMMEGSGGPEESQGGLRSPSGMMGGNGMGMMGDNDADDMMGELQEQFTSHGEQM
jgi:Spy/CpxP family protein refolding chaperone